jgi:hypothetical protein
MNADFPETNRNDANSPSRLSDHDPAIAYFAVATVEHADLESYAEATESTIIAGHAIQFIGVVTNHGPDDATNPGVGFAFDQALPDLQLIDVPADWSCDAPQISGNTTSMACNAASLAADASASFDFDATATAATLPGTLTMAVAATAETDDPDTSNNNAQATVDVTPPQADLSVGLVRTGVTTGSIANFSVPVANAGPDAAANVRVVITGNTSSSPTIAKPAGWTCQRFSGTLHIECVRDTDMPSGTTQTIAFSAIVSRTQPLQFDATVSSDTEDPNAGNNSGGYTKP